VVGATGRREPARGLTGSRRLGRGQRAGRQERPQVHKGEPTPNGGWTSADQRVEWGCVGLRVEESRDHLRAVGASEVEPLRQPAFHRT
jgi:hypothetical protein